MSNKPNDVSAQNGAKRALGVGALSRCIRRAKCIVGIAEHEKTSSLGDKMSSRSTPVDQHAFSICSGVLSLHACVCSRLTPVDPNAFPHAQTCSRSTLVCARARRLSIQMRYPHAQACSRSTTVYALARSTRRAKSLVQNDAWRTTEQLRTHV